MVQLRNSLCFITLLALSSFLAVNCGFRRSSLQIEAQIVYNMGGPQPVARQNLYLLDTDPMQLSEEDAKYKAKFVDASAQEKEALRSSAALFLSMRQVLVGLAEDRVVNKNKKPVPGDALKPLLGVLENSKVFWDAHLAQSAQTDFKGHAVFQDLSPGTYWLMGMTETRAAFTFWNVKIPVKAGENTLMLDQTNALYSQ